MSRLFSIFYQRWLNRRIPCSKPQGIFLIKNSAFLLYNSVTPLGWISAVLRQANGNALTVAGSINISSILLMISLAKSQLSPFLIGRTYDLGSGHAKCLKKRNKAQRIAVIWLWIQVTSATISLLLISLKNISLGVANPKVIDAMRFNAGLYKRRGSWRCPEIRRMWK